jgi:hypothetical protein
LVVFVTVFKPTAISAMPGPVAPERYRQAQKVAQNRSLP